MSEMHYDHDQSQRDYYDIENAKRLKGCVTSFKLLGVLCLIFLTVMLLFGSCSKKPYALLPEAMPLRQEGDRVLGVFPEFGEPTGRFHATWFYFPGYGLVNPQDYEIKVILVRKTSTNP